MAASGRPTPVGTWRLCTPGARAGAIAVVQVRGEIDGAFRRLSIAPVRLGAIAVRELAGIDRGLVARVRPDLALLMPHGGTEIVRRLCATLARAGLEREEDGGCGFPEAASAFEARLLSTLALAASPLAVDLLLDQPRRWAAWGCADPEPATPAPDAEHSRALGRLVDPPLIVALGRSNIGKSTLLNRLAGRTVAAVADEPGTTRDHVGALVELDGLVVRYVDTPGIRSGAPAPEREAREIAEALVADADLVLLLGDHRTPAPPPPGGVPSLAIALRSDLGPAAWPHGESVCARSGEGIAQLVRRMRGELVPDRALTSVIPWRFW